MSNRFLGRIISSSSSSALIMRLIRVNVYVRVQNDRRESSVGWRLKKNRKIKKKKKRVKTCYSCVFFFFSYIIKYVLPVAPSSPYQPDGT